MPEELKERQEEGGTGPPPPEPERPAWLPEKYKTPEDFAAGAKETESYAGRLRTAMEAWQQQVIDQGGQIDAQGNIILPQSAAAASAVQPDAEAWDWENPSNSVGRLIDSRFTSLEERLTKAFQSSISPLAGQLAESTVERVIANTEANLGELPAEVKDGARKLAMMIPPEQRTQPAAIQGILAMQYGLYAQQRDAKARQQPGGVQRTVLGEYALSEGRGSVGAEGAKTLTPRQRAAMEALGMDEKTWAEQEAALERDKERLTREGL